MENNRRGRKKKIVERSEPRGSLGRGKGGRPFPFPRPPLGLLRSLIFFQFDRLLPFPPQRSLVPGYLQQKSDGFYALVLLYLFPLGQWFLFHGGAKPRPKGIIKAWQFWLIQNKFFSFNSFLTKLGSKIRNMYIRRFKMAYRMTPNVK